MQPFNLIELMTSSEEIQPLSTTFQSYQPQSLMCHIKNALTNFTYNIIHSNYINIPGLFHQKIEFSPHDSPSYLLGVKYTFDTKNQFQIHFQNTIWFSYRKNIPGIGNDTGWGCMIRSAMMMVAEAVKRTGTLPLSDLLEKFQGKNRYSFVAVCKAGEIEKRWTTANEIIAIFENITRELKEPELLVLNISHECIMFSHIEIQILKAQTKTLMVLQTKIGMHDLQPNYIPHLKEIMKVRQFCGMLGGAPGKAMYIIGFKDDKVIGLDPHYVQDESSHQQFYFKQFPRGLNFNKLNSSISIGFYVKDVEDYYDLIYHLLEIQKHCEQYKAMGVMISQQDKTRLSKFKQKQTSPQQQKNQSDDDFELLE